MSDERLRKAHEGALQLALIVSELLALTGSAALGAHRLGVLDKGHDGPKLRLVKPCEDGDGFTEE